MAKGTKNTNAGKEGPFLGTSKGTLRYTGPIPDYGRVTNGLQPVQSNRTINTPTGTKRGNVSRGRG